MSVRTQGTGFKISCTKTLESAATITLSLTREEIRKWPLRTKPDDAVAEARRFVEGLFGGTLRIVFRNGGQLAEFGSPSARLDTVTIRQGVARVVVRSENVTLAQLEREKFFLALMLREGESLFRPELFHSLRMESVDPRISFTQGVKLDWRPATLSDVELLRLPSPALASLSPGIMISGPYSLNQVTHTDTRE